MSLVDELYPLSAAEAEHYTLSDAQAAQLDAEVAHWEAEYAAWCRKHWLRAWFRRLCVMLRVRRRGY